jgi:hypothetical protein
VEHDEQLPEVPVVRVGRIYALRDKLVEFTLRNYNEKTLAGDTLSNLALRLSRRMPGRIDRDVLFESIRDLAGQVAEQPMLKRLCWRLAANIIRLQEGESIPAWNVQRVSEWVPAQVMTCVKSTNSFGMPGGDYRIRILGGYPASMVIMKFWTASLASYFGRNMGYNRLRPLRDISELVNLRLMLYLEPDLSWDEPGFRHIECPPNMLKWNRKIIGYRYRKAGRGDWPCPRHFIHPCHDCYVGYVDCPAATHPHTLEGATDETVS